MLLKSLIPLSTKLNHCEVHTAAKVEDQQQALQVIIFQRAGQLDTPRKLHRQEGPLLLQSSDTKRQPLICLDTIL